MSIESGIVWRRTKPRGPVVCAVALTLLAVATSCSDRPTLTEPAAPTLRQPEITASFSTTTGDSMLAGPLVWTGKADYVPDEIVDMFGSGWQPGETVVLTLAEQPQVHASRTFEAVADTLGAFEFEGFRPEAHHAGVTFLLTASGTTSGVQAQTTFTDGIATSSVSSNSNSSGTTASQRLTINVGAIVAGQVAIAQIVVNKDLGSAQICPPSGWTSILRVTRSSGVYVQETFQRTTAAAAGSHEWTFRTSCPGGSLVGGKGASGGVIVFDGVDAGNPIRDKLGANGSSSGPFRAPSTAALAGDLVLRFFGVEKNTTVTSNPAGTASAYVERSSSPVERAAAAFAIPHTSGTTSGTFDVSFGSSAEWTAQTVVLRMLAVVNYTLTVTPAGNGSGTVTSDPAGIDCGSDCSEDYVSGTSVKLMAVADPGSTFTGWSGAGTNDIDGNRVVSMTEAQNVTATFTLNTYALTVTLSGNGSGTVTSDPAGIDCGSDCSEDYNHGTSVKLMAVAALGSTFTGWSGDGTTDVDGNRVVSMTQAREVTATFNIADTQGPVTSNVTANPNPVATGYSFKLSARIDDTQTGNSNIKSAQYSLDGGDTWSSAVPTASPAFNSNTVVDVEWTVPSQPVGVYNVCVRGTDGADNVGAASCILLAVYDPSAGFVTGGGWIDSPAGAYVADPDLGGKATFGFVSRYQKGAKVPSGNTEFQFHAGGMNFKGTLMEWLVISGARAQYKGEGTINGTGSYGFLLTAIDGQASGGGGSDKFRIKIWNRYTGDVVYDNETAADDTGNPTTVLGGGSIVIHAK